MRIPGRARLAALARCALLMPSRGAHWGSSNGAGESGGQDSTSECSICVDTAMEAAVSLGGLLFCWPCSHQWLETRPHRQVCPAGKAGISNEVILFHSRGSMGQQAPRE
ncbi:unnamed protein product [Rangifer tarandus platyrhynchus]|uniref:Uncharacterized protein n=1 Tax=Rangifer tarandus platyrhynchus TaxID=3082113 RepID=A0AC59ZT60_RANTA